MNEINFIDISDDDNIKKAIKKIKHEKRTEWDWYDVINNDRTILMLEKILLEHKIENALDYIDQWLDFKIKDDDITGFEKIRKILKGEDNE